MIRGWLKEAEGTVSSERCFKRVRRRPLPVRAPMLSMQPVECPRCTVNSEEKRVKP